MVLIEMLLPLRVVGRNNYRPYATFFLTLAYLGVFVWEIILTSSGGQPIEHYLETYAFATCEIGQAHVSELAVDGVRALFMTTELPMLFVNLLFLWVFAPLVERFVGRKRFIAYFLTAGIGGYLFSAYLTRGECNVLVGPNSAIAGIIAAFMFLYPTKRIETKLPFFLDRTVDFPAVMFGFVYLMFQFVTAGGGPLSGNFAPVWDEIGGFIIGLAFIFALTLFKPAPKADPFEYLDSE